MSEGEVILYRTDDGSAQFRLTRLDGTVWMNQIELAELYQTSKQAISHHIRNILAEGEVAVEATVKDNLTVQTEGRRQVSRTIKLYRLDMILAVGYRVRSPRGVQFRQWATATLGEYLVKGFVMNDERLKNPGGWTISTNCSNASATSGHRRSGSTRRSVTCSPCRRTTATTRGRRPCSSPRCRTRCCTPSSATRRRN